MSTVSAGNSMDSVNKELRLARDFVRDTGVHIFLTGKAGTGKTTFLHTLQKSVAKRMIITAPTGVAALNAGGVTLHSFFQLPFGPFVPGSETYERNKQRRFRFSREKKRIIQNLDLLVIDEISMVRADLLDAVDAVLRHHRRSDLPFGGVQLLMIGDLRQLSPVARPEEWRLLQQTYASVYFFDSRALAHTELVTIELRHIYRQSDDRFIRLLNRIRDNRLDASSIAELNQRYIEHFTPDDEEGYITLTTHNRSAESLNRKRLQALAEKEQHFQAEISGDFPEQMYPTPADLVLKERAQVMFVRNDPSGDKRYFNGKIGKITKISNDAIRVLCPNDSEEIVVEPAVWENIKYTFSEEHGEIKEETVGTFKQYPIKAAWAITIHKSQGLTFDRAVIDAEAAFSHGQVYVALSRCRSMEGMVLSSPLASRGVETDEAVLNFDEDVFRNPPSEDRLQAAKIKYQQQLLLECFDLRLLGNRLGYLVRLLLGNAATVQIFGCRDIRRVETMAREDILLVSENFRQQLQTIFKDNSVPESDPYIVERIGKASQWFQEKFAAVFQGSVQVMRVETDNAELRKKISNSLNNLKKEIVVKLAGIKSCANGFSPSEYLRALSAAEMDFQPDKVKKAQAAPAYSEADVGHPELFLSLKEWRSKKAGELKVPHYQIMHQRVLIQLAIFLPENCTDLEKIKGVGKKTIEKYGRELVDLVASYRKKHGIKEVIVPEHGKDV